MTSWADLFERAAAYEVDIGGISEAVAERREERE